MLCSFGTNLEWNIWEISWFIFEEWCFIIGRCAWKLLKNVSNILRIRSKSLFKQSQNNLGCNAQNDMLYQVDHFSDNDMYEFFEKSMKVDVIYKTERHNKAKK